MRLAGGKSVMAASRLPRAVHDWLSMLDQVGKSIGHAITEADRRQVAKEKPPRDLEQEVTSKFNRLDGRFAELSEQLDQANSEAAELGAELLAAEESLRGWVDEVSVIARRLRINDENE